VQVEPGGGKTGSDFAIPRVATILLDMNNPVASWKP
jgi:hypothetical protein